MAQRGFTLIELVIVLVVIGILSASAIGLFATRADFAPFLAKDVLISSSLLAQQRALANQQTISVTLTVGQTANDWLFQVGQGSTQFEQKVLDRAGSTLRINGSVLADGGSQVVTYDRSGSVGSTQCFEFEGAASFDVCISATGFAYDCSCP